MAEILLGSFAEIMLSRQEKSPSDHIATSGQIGGHQQRRRSPEGKEGVDSQRSCSAAAKDLGLPFKKEGNYGIFYPPGCFGYGGSSKIYYNKNTRGGLNPKADVVCRRKGTTTTTTKGTTTTTTTTTTSTTLTVPTTTTTTTQVPWEIKTSGYCAAHFTGEECSAIAHELGSHGGYHYTSHNPDAPTGCFQFFPPDRTSSNYLKVYRTQTGKGECSTENRCFCKKAYLGAEYEIRTTGTCSGDITEQECKGLVNMVNPAYSKAFTVSLAGRPPGCYQYWSSDKWNRRLYFNTRSGGVCSKARRCLCNKAGESVIDADYLRLVKDAYQAKK